MKALKHIWDDIKHGENIDLYLTILVAIGLTLLDLAGFAPQSLVASITLSILALIAISLLGNRYKMEQLLEQPHLTGVVALLDEFPPSLGTDIGSAKELWLAGVTLSSTLPNYFPLLEQMVRSGGKVKALLVQPHSPAAEKAASRAYVPSASNVERVVTNTLRSLYDLCYLRTVAPERGSVEIRTINHPMERRFIAINPQTASGVLYIANYAFRTPGGAKPKFVLQAKDSKWYDFYVQEFNLLWESGKEWRCDSNA